MVRGKPGAITPPLELKPGARRKLESMKLKRLAIQVFRELICCW